MPRTLPERSPDGSRTTPAVAHGVTKTGFHVMFAIRAASIVQARELASELLRAAWSASKIDAVPGDDYDVSSINVTPSPRAAPLGREAS
jgi:hypothetical protein